MWFQSFAQIKKSNATAVIFGASAISQLTSPLEIYLVTPHSSAKAIEAALSQNPHLTSLPLPRADVLAPKQLTQTSGTAEILRLPEVQAAITKDFLVLPCDIVCELPGERLLETWMIQQAGLGGAASVGPDYGGPVMGIGGENGGRRGGLGVWFQTKAEGHSKGDETDFVMTTPLDGSSALPIAGSLRSNISRLVYSTTTDTLNDITEEKKSFPIRHGLVKKHGRIRMLTTYRDAHIYIFPRWVLEMVKKNESMDSISEDVVGWWAKAGWQDGLAGKLGLRQILEKSKDSSAVVSEHRNGTTEDDMDIASLSTTRIGNLGRALVKNRRTNFATRMSTHSTLERDQKSIEEELTIPPMLAYIQPSSSDTPLIRRVDTTALLLSISLRLAKLESIEDIGKAISSPFAHPHKIAYPEGVASQRCTISKADSLLAENVTVEEKTVIKESVIGANCHIKTGARLIRCILMDGAVVGEKCQLTGCILGRRCQIEKDSILKDCEVQEGIMVEAETDAKGEKFMKSDGLYDEGDLDENMDMNDGQDAIALDDHGSNIDIEVA